MHQITNFIIQTEKYFYQENKFIQCKYMYLLISNLQVIYQKFSFRNFDELSGTGKWFNMHWKDNLISWAKIS